MANKLFYLNGAPVDVEISPILAQTLDETIDNITIDLEINERAEPYPPIKTEVEVVQVYDDETTETINKFVVSSDSVQLVTENPLRYKHTLTLVQRAQVLTKKEMRNTVFSTSLETSIFSLTISNYLYLYHIGGYSDTPIQGVGAKDYWLVNLNSQYETLRSRYEQEQVYATIDLSKRKINNISFRKKFIAWTRTGEGAPNPSTPQQGVTQIRKPILTHSEPDNFLDIFAEQDSSDRPQVKLKFEVTGIPGTNVMETTISNNGYNDSSFIQKIPSNVIEWINTFNTGTLTISIETEFKATGWANTITYSGRQMSPVGRAPWLAYLTFDLEINSIEDSCYDVIQTLLNQQLKETADYNRTNDPDHYVPLFELPTPSHNPDLYELLTTTSAPNFVLTQGNMYEMLVEIFKLFDAIFTIDNDGYLDIEYYNDHKKMTLTDNSKAGRSSSLGEERYANRLVSFYQNTKINDRFPNSNVETATAYLRSKSLGIPKESDFVFMVPKPIDYILSVKVNKKITFAFESACYDYQGLIISSQYIETTPQALNMLVDITRYVQETSLWSILSESKSLPINGNWNNVGKYNSLDYTRGSKYINVSGYYDDYYGLTQDIYKNVIMSAVNSSLGHSGSGTSPIFSVTDLTDWKDVKLFVSYIALTDGRVVNESIDYKYDGGILINQNNGSIDINKLGLNMVGLSLKLGQPTLTMTQKICKWEDRIQKGQFFIDGNGDRWVANTCNYTLINKDLIEASIEFVKNFNGLASRIELNREKRLSNISNDLTTKCEENYGEYIYYTSKAWSNFDFSSETIALNRRLTYNQIAMTFGATLSPIASTRVSRTDKIISTTISALNSNDSYTNQTLAKVTGYIQNVTDTAQGKIIINANSSFTGAYVEIPYFSSYHADGLVWNLAIDGFDVKKYNDYKARTHPEEGDQVTVYILKVGKNVMGAILEQTNDEIYNAYVFNPYLIEYASLTAYNDQDEIIQEDEYTANNIAIPMVTYGSGNSVCFEMSYDSPITAGTQLLKGYDSVYDLNKWFSKYVLYTNKGGVATKFSIDFVMLQEELTRQYPKLEHADGTPLATTSFGKINKLAYYKKPNEIFALNYQLHFLPAGKVNDEFITNEFIKNNGFANGLSTKNFQIYYSTSSDFGFSIFDERILASDNLTRFSTTVSAGNGSGNTGYIQFSHNLSSSALAEVKSWAVCDLDNNIYFASNVPPIEANSSSPGFRILFMTRHHRKEE